VTVEGIRTTVQPILDRLRSTAREREERRDFAFDEVRRLAEAGILLVGIPAEIALRANTLRAAVPIANHNPRDWKLAKVGAWYLTGEEPPTSGLF
jgi:alkylation response protein AidB-like acyl-CoA dehydrogenase